MNRFFLFLLIILCGIFHPSQIPAQSARWQQKVDYQMNIKVDSKLHRLNGKQILTYYNQSPDALGKVFYHLYFNAFQPGSMMDVRNRNLALPDDRITSKLPNMAEADRGYQKIISLTQDGTPMKFTVEETILIVELAKPIPSGGKAVFEMEFESQIPKLTRRAGRENAEGIMYSMGQWYPKICEYDIEGWHSNPYISREFFGVWGSFDVKITLDDAFTVAATGVLQNPDEVGHGYSKKEPAKKANELTWHFKAENVHDFVWTADPDYTHLITQVPDGPEVHFFYVKDSNTVCWDTLPKVVARAFEFMNAKIGKYPYPVFSVMQGGDGGMEYPMGTIITGYRPCSSLVAVTVHEMIHSWFYGMLASDEGKYPWMDEGFTTYMTGRTIDYATGVTRKNPQERPYSKYFAMVKTGLEEPSTTHSDHYHSADSYYNSAYFKSAVFLHQLSYVVGQDALDKALSNYFTKFKFTHPYPADFKRMVEQSSGLELDWYFEHWLNTTLTIDFGITSTISTGETTWITIRKKGEIPMPVEVWVKPKEGAEEIFYIPIDLMRGEKPNETTLKRTLLADWPWTHKEYLIELPWPATQIEYIQIDPSGRIPDIKPEDNRIQFGEMKAGPR